MGVRRELRRASGDRRGESSADLGDVADLGSYDAPNLEAVAVLDPDLVIGPPDADVAEDFSPVAPYLGVDARENPSGEPFETARFLADVVGVEDAVETQIAEYEAAVAAFTDEHAESLDGLEYTYLDEYDADVVILGTYDGAATDGERRILQGTFAAQRDQILEVDANRWTFHLLRAQLDVLAELDEFFGTRDVDPSGDF
ncbi:MAG: ABC transporter substrate-binding protein [Kineosporiaceae bacterium]